MAPNRPGTIFFFAFSSEIQNLRQCLSPPFLKLADGKDYLNDVA